MWACAHNARPFVRFRESDAAPHRGPHTLEVNLRRLLVVCTGNTCRSPMAVSLLRDRLQAAGLAGSVQVGSAGVHASAGRPASREALVVMAARGLHLGDHCSQPLTPQLLDAADLILVMEQEHRHTILAQAPEAAAKVRLFSWLSGEEIDIDDPCGRGPNAYAATVDHLALIVDRGWPRLLEALGL